MSEQADLLLLIERNADHVLKLVGEVRELVRDSEAATKRLDEFEAELRAQQEVLLSLEGTRRDVKTWGRALRWAGASVIATLLFLSSIGGLEVALRWLGII